MSNITKAQANNIVSTLIDTQANNTSNINVTNIINTLKDVKGTTFATLTQASKVKTAAAHKAQNIYKITVQSVTLCNSKSSLYVNAVNKQVTKAAEITNTEAEAFNAVPSNYVMLNDSYSVVALKSNTNKHYLRAVINKALDVQYYCVNTQRFLTKQEVAHYLTASASKALLDKPANTVVKHADVVHNVTVRTFALGNIFSLNVAKQQLTA